MASTFIKAQRIASAALGLLEREIVLPALVWRDAGGDFRGAAGDTISIKVPARTQARTRTLRGTRPTTSEGAGIITMDELTETKVDVTLDTDVYSAIPVTDEELTLDIVDFGQQVLEPQVRAVAEGVENAVAAEMTGATYATTVTIDTTDPYKSLIDAGVALSKANIPRSERVVVMGADVEGVILKSDHLSRVDQSGSADAFRRAEMGRMANFPLYVTNALPSNVAFAFHRTAYVLGMRAPVIPAGVTFGDSQSRYGLAMRWIRDYDFRNVQDRSLVDLYIGTSIVADGANEVQTVTITGSPTGGTFTLTYDGQTTATIAYNATAATVQSRLIALSTLEEGNVSVTGSAGGPYTVTFTGGKDVTALTASGAGLTGGSSPAVTVATATVGGSASFVRAVKLVLP
jgi:hypothetical protein